MRSGRTTGACAAAAAMAAIIASKTGLSPISVDLPLPDHNYLTVPIAWASIKKDLLCAAVQKDSGDDPDVTNGLMVIVKLTPNNMTKLTFVAGAGVGVITKPGLSLPVGEAAINPIPRQMIEQAILTAGADLSWTVEISIPGGEEIAQKTFNPRLGIVGGLSILGTSGIVRPYCIKAQRQAFASQCAVIQASGIDFVALTPGNIGFKALQRHFNLPTEQIIEVGNDWDGGLTAVDDANFTHILIGGHPGKLGKLAAGIWSTHSKDSMPALDIVRQLAERVQIDLSIYQGNTCEGLFSCLTPEISHQLATITAQAISQKLRQRLSKATYLKIWLCNMAGEEIGAIKC